MTVSRLINNLKPGRAVKAEKMCILILLYKISVGQYINGNCTTRPKIHIMAESLKMLYEE